ncbi:beta-ketoacyl synthase N-terminal-like domain-containing protein [Nocardia sp. NPDC051321]|uniref:beta-ketoacyl synthase N-terminal-like domain-containing protein n=1 Tax=Nocardia sp. NPDC051321 TaxID=3364323 RepID=UPI0037B0000F
MEQDVVVVGLACRYANARDSGQFWRTLATGHSDIAEVGPDQWDRERFFAPGDRNPGKINTKWLGRLAGARYFDNAFFNLSPREAVAIDPQHRLLLEETWHCVEDSGLPIDLLQSGRTSVNVGLMAQDYLIKGIANNKQVDAFDPTGNYACIAANRISFLLNLTGPSRTVDTACSASLVALAQGRADLLTEDCDFALVGGVNVICSPWRYLAFSQSRMLSPDGRCFTFDRRANGYVPGEGVGVVLLTTRAKAERLGCHIYGVLRGIATNHNGHNRSLTAPSVAAQADVINRALAAADVEPAAVSYVEAHGTGTSLGDPIEIEALNSVYGRDRGTPLAVGSVKTNIGHVEAGAGMAGLIKILLMLRHGRIAPTLNMEIHNPLLHAVGATIRFPNALVDWPGEHGPRTAGISSFGFGGVNCHAVVQEYEAPVGRRTPAPRRGPAVFTVAAKSPDALRKTLAAWADEPRWSEPEFVPQLCHAANQRLLNLPYRLGVAADGIADLLAAVRRGEPSAVRHVAAPPEPMVVLAPHDSASAAGRLGAVSDSAAGRELRALIADRDGESIADGRLTRFVAHLDGLAELARRRVTITEVVALDAVGAAAALVHAQAIPMEEAVGALLVDEPPVLQAPPQYTVLIGAECLLPNEIDADYLRELVTGCASTLTEVTPYITQAALLLDHQHTFARALGRWEQLLSARGFSVVDAIRRFAELAPELTPEQLAVLALAVNVAAGEIDRAWGLTPPGWLPPATAELAVLICDGIVDRSDAVAALFGDAELTELAESARDRAVVRSARLTRFGALTKRTEQSYAGRRLELPAPDADLAAAVAGLAERSSAVVVLGPWDAESALDIVHIADGEPRTMTAALLELWLRGCDVDWAGPQLDETPRLPGLPGYVFDQHSFWHEDTDLRIDGQVPTTRPAADVATLPVRDATPSDPQITSPSFRPTPGSSGDGSAESLDSGQAFAGKTVVEPVSANAGETEFGARLEQLLIDLIAEATRSPRENLRAATEFADIGIDSLIIHTLNLQLSERFGDIAATLFFECRNIGEVADRIQRDHADGVQKHFGSASAPTPEPASNGAAPPAKRPVARRRIRRESTEEGIAVIGFDARFPGADSVPEFWQNLCDGVDSVAEIPLDRWDHAQYFDPRRNVPGKVYSKWGGFLSDVDLFDAAAFGIAPVEAAFMDPQERLFLEATRGCLEVAGYSRERLPAAHDNEVGVYVGASFNNYQLVQHEAAGANSYAPINSQTYAVANRVSYLNDFRGPSLTLDTACSSSLYALHLACESLRRGECSLAVAGGVNLSLHPSKYQMLAEYQFLSSDGRCRAFGEGGDGYVPAEAVGAFLLKPLADAACDGDRVYGVIRGSALTHGGRTNGFTVPSPAAHTTAIERALWQARWTPDTITYFEAHGTGTRLGDPVEIAAIRSAFEMAMPRRQRCAIGSVKSNIGHAEAAAGVAQLAKVLLQLHNRTLVPSLLHAERTNPAIDFTNSPVYVQRTLEDWDPARMGAPATPRRAGLSSIGAGGTNVHVLIEEYQP